MRDGGGLCSGRGEMCLGQVEMCLGRVEMCWMGVIERGVAARGVWNAEVTILDCRVLTVSRSLRFVVHRKSLDAMFLRWWDLIHLTWATTGIGGRLGTAQTKSEDFTTSSLRFRTTPA